jgi:hypothetical protein
MQRGPIGFATVLFGPRNALNDHFPQIQIHLHQNH